MQHTPSLSRRWVLLIAMISPALLGSQFKCVAISNPSVTTAHIDELEAVTLRVGDVMHVSGSGTGAPPLQFAWDFGDGDTLAYGTQAAHVYTTQGNYRVTLSVRDAIGNVARDSTQVVVSGRVSLVSPALISDAVTGRPVEFAALTLEGDATALTYSWMFSDGQSAMGSQVDAIFPLPGVYFVWVTVSNDLGAVAVAPLAFEIIDAAR
jgi:hypothetical protein